MSIKFKGSKNMNCCNCEKGKIKVYLNVENEIEYTQDKSGNWKPGKTKIIAHTDLYAKCDACGTEYTVNEYLFFNKGEVQIYEPGSELVEILFAQAKNPSIKVLADDDRVFRLLESLGWNPDPLFKKMQQIPGMFEKMYYAPKGSGLFGLMNEKEAEDLISATEKALSDNNVPYIKRVLSFADML